jgi:DNA-binding beta-propeller fold protein YncE
MNNRRRTPVSIRAASVIMLPHMRIRTVVKAVLWTLAIAATALLALVVWQIFPGTPGSAKSLKFEGFVLLPKDRRAGVLTVLDYLTLSGKDLFVTNVSTGTVYKIPLHGEGLPATTDVSMFELEPAAHGVVIDPASGMAYVTRSEANTVDIFDPSKMSLVSRIPVADDPDGIFYMAANRTVYAACGDGKTATLIDPATRTVSATISLPGKPEFGVFDTKTNLFYQNLEDISSIAAIDLNKHVVTAQWPLQDCVHPTGMAIDEPAHQLFLGCGGNSRLAVFDLEQHRVVTSIPVGGGPDSVAYDAGLHRIYVTGRAGDLCVVERDSKGAFATVDTIALHFGAHTLAVDPESHKVYVAYASLLTAPRIAVFSAVGS